MGELKPCPFCGGEARFKRGLPGQQQRDKSFALVQCKQCGCRTPVSAQCAYQPYKENDAYVIDKWNKRVTQEPKQVMSISEFSEAITVGVCPACNQTIVNDLSKPTSFCKFCGQAVKWE